MAKKKNNNELLKSKNSIITELRNDRWIYNPVVYSQISGDFTLLQQRILVGIVERLQQRIYDSVDEQKRTKSFPDLFDESEVTNKQTIELNIPADDLGVLPSNYVQLQQAAEALGRITMKYPRYNSNGRVKTYVVASLFPRIEMPVYHKDVDGDTVEGKRTGVLRVVMLTENIRDIFSMQHGYVKHISHIARVALKKRTPRLYIYLSRYKDVGHKRVPYNDLVEYLGLTDEYYFQTNYGSDSDRKESSVNPYSSWSKVKMLVLEPVRREMKELADRGEINFSFDYEPVYSHGKTRGIPVEVGFTIIPSKMGEEKINQDKRANAIFDFIDKYIDWCPDLSNLALLSLVEDMDDDMLNSFFLFAYKDVRTIVERKQPDDVAPYVMGVLRRWKRAQTKAEIKQPSFFEPAPAETDNSENKNVIGEYSAEWNLLLQRCSPEYRSWLSQATHKGSARGFMWIDFHSKEVLNAFNKFEADNKSLHSQFVNLLGDIMGSAAKGRILVRGCDGVG